MEKGFPDGYVELPVLIQMEDIGKRKKLIMGSIIQRSRSLKMLWFPGGSSSLL